MTLKFGTDGVRGEALTELTPELVVALGRAAARVLDGPGRFFIGRDTRQSGPALLAALTAGLTAEGIDVVDLGVIPTPGVAAMAAEHRTPAAMISASHNPWPDNGIKFFAAGGTKLTDDVEQRLEDELESARIPAAGGRGSAPSRAGRVDTDDAGAATYVASLLDALGGARLGDLRVVLDCANGAASGLARSVFERAGARVVAIHDEPDGTNINHECGSTHPGSLQAAVVEHHADLGLAFDGDADRVLAVDEAGGLVDGDHLLALFARDLRDRGRLRHDTLVVTVMSNLGLRLAMQDAGIAVVETKVGDRYVLEAMAEGGYVLGGEQSGHIVFGERSTTGDGVLTGLLLADLVVRLERPLSDLATAAMTSLPQVLHNVRIADRAGLAGATAVWDEVAAVEAELGRAGRVLLRPSGTEPVVRVMVEAPELAQAEAAAGRLVAAVEGSLGGSTP